MADSETPAPAPSDITSIAPKIEEKELNDYSHLIADAMAKSLPSDTKFALFIYRDRGDKNPAVKFITNGLLDDVDVVIDRWKDKVFGSLRNSPEWNAAAELRRLRAYLINAEIPKVEEDPQSIVSAAINRIREIKARYRADVPTGKRVL